MIAENNHKDRRSTIMIVDDECDSRQLLADILDNEGYMTSSRADSTRALQDAIENPPDLFLLDVMMPELDGFELCRRLKAHPSTHFVPVVMVTARVINSRS